MSKITSVEVSSLYQIKLPASVREQLGIDVGDELLVSIQGEMITLKPAVYTFTQRMAGLHKEIWRDVDTAAYLMDERSSW
ncbi:MAG TPA: AbrB/MazE/SpoVT family DNA-binding domain-containing protein [Chloroflexi bacterium]|nr:AbrB/MazE/SpoVT family DNA-binding domain-containing protein [Chloroflexota bacterium]